MSILAKPAKELLEKNILDRKLHKKVGKELLTKWNIPLNISTDLLTLRKSPAEVSDYILYHIICTIDKKALPVGYPPKHLKDELEKQYNDDKVNLPIKYTVVKIDDDQWVGKITARELFRLGNSMLINYNDKAQRVMRRVVTENGEYYEIKLNENAVNQIENSFSNKRYIPNTITLNIPFDDSSSFDYDEKTNELTIRKIKMFDILDGYHRYVAINRICSLDVDFDYVMELRITNFTDDKARQFIWQEDQKTKMSKIDSNSLNKYNAANMIVKKLQDSVYGNIIQYNKGIIGSAELSQAISTAYGIRQSQNYNISFINATSKEIVDGFDKISENIPDIFDTKLDAIEIYCLMTMIKNKVYDKKSFKHICKYANTEIKGREFKHQAYLKLTNELKGGVQNV